MPAWTQQIIISGQNIFDGIYDHFRLVKTSHICI